MYLIEKINRSRKTLKEVLSAEWDTDSIHNLSNKELEIMYSNTNTNAYESSGCNIVLNHRVIKGHKLHVIYYNFPELNRSGTKVNKTCCEKLTALYKTEGIEDDFDAPFEKDDSLFVIINEKLSESMEKSVEETFLKGQEELASVGLRPEITKQIKDKNNSFNTSHFRNIHMFHVDSLVNNLLNHRLVPYHEPLRDEQVVATLLKRLNATKSQLPVILRTDAVGKFHRLAPGDVCKITRKSNKSGESTYYRVCR
jgi:DNA-directed RNA polymerase subunit H (RpoH/RPB5)